ncbi:MAG: CdaR family protein [Clostridia bacterium]|nr:CdaR family protein [Clostridia bacterium]
MNSNNKFTKDIGWKLLSLFIAIGLWFMVINTENPMETRSYSTTVQLQNEEALFERGYVVVNEDEISSMRITVRLRGQRLALDRLSQSSTKVQAIVDLNNVIYSYSGDPVSVPVNIVIPSVVNNSFEILSKSVQSVTVDIQPYINKDFEVKTVINSEDKDIEELVNAVSSPATVTAYGAKSVINSIAEVRAEVAPDSYEDGAVLTAVPVAYDADGTVVNKVTFSSNEISVRLSMDDSKSVRILEDTTGKPADGYIITGVYMTPDNIAIAGKAEDMLGFSLLRLPDIDVSGADSNIVMTFDAEDYLPEGVRLLGGSGTITVTITVEQEETRNIIIPSENITDNGTASDGLTAVIESGDLTVTISGNKSAVESAMADDIKVSVDLSGLEAGTYDDIPVEFDTPDGITIKNPGAVVKVTLQ